MTNRMQLFWLIYLFLFSSTCSGDVFAYHQEHMTVFIASVFVHRYCCRPAAIPVDNIRSCKYSQVLLTLGENIARNM